MHQTYYFDTSIWLDFLEERDEPHLPKSAWAKELVTKIALEGGIIILSDNNFLELETLGYSKYDIEILLTSLQSLITVVESTKQQLGKAKDVALKRGVPVRDALHALIARDTHAVLVTLDAHFQKLSDIIVPHSTKELI